jgi:predicted nuclease with RNAse H fold
MLFGIDFGAKMAGTTAVCMDDGNELKILQSIKNQDADVFLTDLIAHHLPSLLMIDAPLSLPGVYFGKGTDFFYRQCDKELQAMSPMFLGGLTARAMRLKENLSKLNVKILETYPKKIAENAAKSFHEQEESKIVASVCTTCEMHLKQIPQSKHAFDAFLAWYAGWRYLNGSAQHAGDSDEGLIWY